MIFLYLCFLSVAHADLAHADLTVTQFGLVSVADTIRSFYEFAVTERSGTLVFNQSEADLGWTSPQFINPQYWNTAFISASADIKLVGNQKYYRIMLNGGALRRPGFTRDETALIACHELGHLIGGEPTKLTNGGGISVIIDGEDDSGFRYRTSVEGQSDYWAASRCLKQYFSVQNNAAWETGLNSPRNQQAAALCEKNYVTRVEQLICERSIESALRFAYDEWAYSKERKSGIPAPQVNTPDSVVVEQTRISHPSPQCRLDTFVAGALCKECNSDLNVTMGPRPSCWYHP